MAMSEALLDMAGYHGLSLHTDQIYIQFSMDDRPRQFYRLVKVYNDGLTVRRLLNPDTNPDAEGPVIWINYLRVKLLMVVLKPIAKRPKR